MNNKVCNPKTEVPTGIALNDQDYMTILLTHLKELEKNMTVALTEASNSVIYLEYKDMFEKLIKLQRASYEVMFKLGWYTLEEVPSTKVETLQKNLQSQLDDVDN